MREAAADLDFEEAARLRDEIKRLRATELAVIDDPTAKAVAISRGGATCARPRSKVHKPALDEMGIALYHESVPHRPGGKRRKREAAQADARRDGPRARRPSPIAPARARPPAAPACAAAGSRAGGGSDCYSPRRARESTTFMCSGTCCLMQPPLPRRAAFAGDDGSGTRCAMVPASRGQL